MRGALHAIPPPELSRVSGVGMPSRYWLLHLAHGCHQARGFIAYCTLLLSPFRPHASVAEHDRHRRSTPDRLRRRTPVGTSRTQRFSPRQHRSPSVVRARTGSRPGRALRGRLVRPARRGRRQVVCFRVAPPTAASFRRLSGSGAAAGRRAVPGPGRRRGAFVGLARRGRCRFGPSASLGVTATKGAPPKPSSLRVAYRAVRPGGDR